MPTLSDTEMTTELALAFQPTGFEEIPGATILTRLNYYDGKFLRADDLQLEQNYLRRLAELGARAGGAGLVYGFDVFLGSGDALTIGGGLGFDPAGRVLYLPGSFSTALQTLVDATARTSSEAFALSEGTSGFAVCTSDDATTPAPTSAGGAEYYLITIAHAEEACGDEEVFGKLCDDACATSTDRAYLVEGVVVRARPYRPTTAFATSKVVQLAEKHLRSLLVSAAYADEKLAVPSLISKAGLLAGPWCTGAAAPSGWEVPIAVVGVLSSSRFVDEWVVRRERMDTPPRRYWAWTMAMRPWEAYLAQILQFQCQLPTALSGAGNGATGGDPCADQRVALGEAVRYIGQLRVAVEQQPTEVALVEKDAAPAPAETTLSTNPAVFLNELGGISKLQDLQLRLTDIYRRVTVPSQRILVDGGIVELPPAGYLPVTPGSTTPVDEQVRRLMGDGVDLRFCVTTPDYVPHALEKAQHMDRISLLQGLDNPANKPPVDVLIPGGVLGTSVAATGWEAKVVLRSFLLNLARATSSNEKASAVAAPDAAAPPAPPAPAPSPAKPVEITTVGISRTPMLSFHGVGRTAPTATGAEIAVAAPGTVTVTTDVSDALALSGYAGANVDVDPFTLGVGGIFNVTGEAALAMVPAPGSNNEAEQMQATGSARLTVVSPSQQTANGSVMTASGTLHASGGVSGATSNSGTSSIDVLVKIAQTSTVPPTYEVTVTKAGDTSADGILLSATWSGTPLTVMAFADDLSSDTTGTSVGTINEISNVAPVSTATSAHVIAAELIEDSDVFSAANPLNVAAHQALQTLADALGDARYTGAIADKLFDPTAQGGQSSGITATQDWVLFHRRRHKHCQKAQVVTPVVSKTYGVYVANTRSATTLEARAVGARGRRRRDCPETVRARRHGDVHRRHGGSHDGAADDPRLVERDESVREDRRGRDRDGRERRDGRTAPEPRRRVPDSGVVRVDTDRERAAQQPDDALVPAERRRRRPDRAPHDRRADDLPPRVRRPDGRKRRRRDLHDRNRPRDRHVPRPLQGRDQRLQHRRLRRPDRGRRKLDVEAALGGRIHRGHPRLRRRAAGRHVVGGALHCSGAEDRRHHRRRCKQRDHHVASGADVQQWPADCPVISVLVAELNID